MNVEDLLISQPDTGEQALEIVQTLVRSGAVNLVVVDSVATLVPRSEIEGDMGDATMGMQALRKLSGAINQTKTGVVFTNQLRQKSSVMFGNPRDHPRRPRAQVLRHHPPGRVLHPVHQGQGGDYRQPRACAGG